MKYVSISGVVAAGKTTLLNRLLEHYGDRAMAHEERPQDNPFVEAYYADPPRWSFHAQVAFLALYFDNTAWRDADRELYFFDRCLTENLVIARYRRERGDLTADEYAFVEKTAKALETAMPPVDKYIYLRCSVPLQLEHARARGREYEKGIDRAFCEMQQALYEEWVRSLPSDRVLIVDMDEGPDLQTIIDFIDQ